MQFQKTLQWEKCVSTKIVVNKNPKEMLFYIA